MEDIHVQIKLGKGAIWHSRGRGLFRHCAYPTRGSGKGDSTRESPLDLHREHFQFAIFV